jgi:6-pyruvoyltetrahydropterin/6-carboxytetrahydropterin synthase
MNGSGLDVQLGRRYRFAASHRLHRADLSEAENARLYGKCNNPHGHGHNYVLETVWAGDVDPETGMIANPADIDAFVDRQVLQVFDQVSLNEDVPEFANTVPTTENVCMDIFRRLKTFPGAKLKRVRVEETSNNSFEYTGTDNMGEPESLNAVRGEQSL